VLDQQVPEAARWGGYPGGLPVTKGEPLFPRK
jgi:methionyl-tRNA synthetase